MKKLCINIILLFALLHADAQVDIFYVNRDIIPQNPARGGVFDGSFQVGGLLRQQWGNYIDNSDPTYQVYGLNSNYRFVVNGDYISVGAKFLKEGGGAARFEHNNLHINSTFSKGLWSAQNYNSYLVGGLEFGYGSIGFNTQNAFFGSQYGVNGFSLSIASGENFGPRASYGTFNTGVLFYLNHGNIHRKFVQKWGVYAGASFHHTNMIGVEQPTISLSNGSETATFDRKFTASLGGNVGISGIKSSRPDHVLHFDGHFSMQGDVIFGESIVKFQPYIHPDWKFQLGGGLRFGNGIGSQTTGIIVLNAAYDRYYLFSTFTMPSSSLIDVRRAFEVGFQYRSPINDRKGCSNCPPICYDFI